MKPEVFSYIVNNWRSLFCNSMTRLLSYTFIHSLIQVFIVPVLCGCRCFSRHFLHCSKALFASAKTRKVDMAVSSRPTGGAGALDVSTTCSET